MEAEMNPRFCGFVLLEFLNQAENDWMQCLWNYLLN